MNDIDIETVKKRYSDRYKQFGYSPETLGWGKNGRQELRFSILTQIGDLNEKSILDVGCGFGDLCGYVMSKGLSCEYTGIDIVPDLIEEGKQRFPHGEYILGDFDTHSFDKQFDYIIASGIFNFKLLSESNAEYIRRMLRKMIQCSKHGVAVDFMSTYVDYQHPIAFHTNPASVLDIALKTTNKFVIRQDYMPYEYSLYLYPRW